MRVPSGEGTRFYLELSAGEGAEEVISNMPDFMEDLVEEHEEAGHVALGAALGGQIRHPELRPVVEDVEQGTGGALKNNE